MITARERMQAPELRKMKSAKCKGRLTKRKRFYSQGAKWQRLKSLKAPINKIKVRPRLSNKYMNNLHMQ